VQTGADLHRSPDLLADGAQSSRVSGSLLGVVGSRQAKQCHLILRKLAHRPRRRADDQAPRLEPLAFGYQGARTDDALRANHSPVEDSRPHSDQRLILDRAAVEYGLVADRDPGADCQRRPGIGMADGSVLEIAFVAQDDRRVVGPDYCAEPDAYPGTQSNVANEVCRGSDPRTFAQRRCNPINFVKRHAAR